MTIPYFRRAIGFILIATSIALLAVQIANAVTIEHDDVVSVLAATCHQGLYEQSVPQGQWVSANQWQHYWKIESVGCFGRIASDLANYDIHPPLYFWLLHLWLAALGVSFPGALTLNLFLNLLTAIGIFIACKSLEVSRHIGMVAAVLWFLNVSSLSAAGFVRQYSLVALVVTLLLIVTIRLIKRFTLQGAWLFFIAALLGMLTHYQFLIPLGSTVVVTSGILLRQRRIRETVWIQLICIAAAISFYVIHPAFLSSIAHYRAQAQGFSLDGFRPRIANVVWTLSAVLVPFASFVYSQLKQGIGSYQWPIFSFFALACLVAGLWSLRGPYAALREKGNLGRFVALRYLPILVGSMCGMAIFVLYFLFISPEHAMSSRYILFITPFLFVALGQFIERLTGHTRAAVIIGLLVWQFGGSTFYTSQYVLDEQQAEAAFAQIAETPIVVDSVARGVLPQILWHVSSNNLVYADSQDDLLREFFGRGNPNVKELFYISSLSYGNTKSKQDEILGKFFEDGYTHSQYVEGITDFYVYHLTFDVN